MVKIKIIIIDPEGRTTNVHVPPATQTMATNLALLQKRMIIHEYVGVLVKTFELQVAVSGVVLN